MKPKPELCRQIILTKRTLRRAKRPLSGADYERHRVALKGLTELQANPMRPMLAEYVAMAVRRAG